MDTMTVVLSVSDQVWLAIYVASILTVTFMNLSTMFKGSQYGIGTIWFITLLNIFVPIIVGISTGLWWLSVVGLGYLVMLVYIIIQAMKMALKDVNDEDQS